jgi:hypothetical protein
MAGGLFSSIGGVSTVVIALLTRGRFISYLSKKFFLARNTEHLKNGTETLPNSDLDDIVAPHSQDNYRTLETNT